MSKRDTIIGRRIQERREMLGWSKAKLARMSGLDAAQISRFENGQRRISEEHLIAIAGALGWSAERFVSTDSNVIEAPSDVKRVPLLSQEQIAQWEGEPTTIWTAESAETVPVSMSTPASSFAMQVRGNSMAPLFLHGDLIVIAPTIAPEPGDYALAVADEADVMFRRYREIGVDERNRKVIELVPVNPDYPSIRSDRQPITLIGKMIRQMRDYHRM